MEKTHKIDVVSIRLVEEPPLYSSKELKNPCDVAELFPQAALSLFAALRYP